MANVIPFIGSTSTGACIYIISWGLILYMFINLILWCLTIAFAGSRSLLDIWKRHGCYQKRSLLNVSDLQWFNRIVNWVVDWFGMIDWGSRSCWCSGKSEHQWRKWWTRRRRSDHSSIEMSQKSTRLAWVCSILMRKYTSMSPERWTHGRGDLQLTTSGAHRLIQGLVTGHRYKIVRGSSGSILNREIRGLALAMTGLPNLLLDRDIDTDVSNTGTSTSRCNWGNILLRICLKTRHTNGVKGSRPGGDDGQKDRKQGGS